MTGLAIRVVLVIDYQSKIKQESCKVMSLPPVVKHYYFRPPVFNAKWGPTCSPCPRAHLRQSIMQFSCQKSEQKKIREAEVFD
jgi:hypothetical protein